MQTVLERILTTERERRQTAQKSQDGFAVPSLAERPLTPIWEPLLVTNMRGAFLRTKVSRARGVARYGFFEALPDQEGPIIQNLFEQLAAYSVSEGWGLISPTLSEAVSVMRGRGFEPRSLVAPLELLQEGSPDLTRADADALMSSQGYVSCKDGFQTLLGDLLPGRALLAASPSLTGYYVRVDDRLGLLLMRVNQVFQLVEAS